MPTKHIELKDLIRIILLIFILLTASCVSYPKGKFYNNVYENEEMAYSVTIPGGWKFTDDVPYEYKKYMNSSQKMSINFIAVSQYTNSLVYFQSLKFPFRKSVINKDLSDYWISFREEVRNNNHVKNFDYIECGYGYYATFDAYSDLHKVKVTIYDFIYDYNDQACIIEVRLIGSDGAQNKDLDDLNLMINSLQYPGK